MKKKLIFIIAGVVLFLVILTVVVIFLLTKPKKEKVVIDPETIGNLAGNLLNSGLFLEDETDIYFSNSYDGGSLYKMNKESGKFIRLNKNRTYSINKAGDRLYYCMLSERSTASGLSSLTRNAGIYSCKLDGTDVVNLNANAGIAMQYYGGKLYYQQSDDTGTIFVSQPVDKVLEKNMLSNFVVNPVSIDKGTLYYHNNADKHYLYTMDLSTNTATQLMPVSMWNPIYDRGYIYYIAMDGTYNLCRRTIDGGEEERLTTDWVDTFNVYKNVIFYAGSEGDSPAIKRMQTDGSNLEVVRTGIYHDINITEDYTYYTQYNSIIPIYKQSTFGMINEEDFAEAANAAFAETTKESK